MGSCSTRVSQKKFEIQRHRPERAGPSASTTSPMALVGRRCGEALHPRTHPYPGSPWLCEDLDPGRREMTSSSSSCAGMRAEQCHPDPGGDFDGKRRAGLD